MKFIREYKTYENKGEWKPLDVEIINMIFQEYIDEKLVKVNHSKQDDNEWCDINIIVPKFVIEIGVDIDDYIVLHEKTLDFLKDIRVCLRRLKDEYPLLAIDFYYNNYKHYDSKVNIELNNRVGMPDGYTDDYYYSKDNEHGFYSGF